MAPCATPCVASCESVASPPIVLGSAWNNFSGWWKDTKPTDVVAALLTLASVAIAIYALHKANEVSSQQAEAAAPILAPGTPLAERGKNIRVATEYAEVTKRADWLYLDRSPTQTPTRGRFVIPLRNGGSGIGLTIGLPVLVADCAKEPALLPEAAIKPPLGTYSFPSGESDQLGYLQPGGAIAHGTVPGHNEYWYSFDYKDFGLIGTGKPKPANLLLWYTDGAQRKLRWTCIQYTGFGRRSDYEGGVVNQYYGTRSMVDVELKAH